MGLAEASLSGLSVPLIVDVDGTLLKTDLLVESFLALLSRKPWRALLALAELRKGKAAFKARLASEAEIDISLMPVREEVITFLHGEKARGRKIYLASAADAQLVSALSDHLGLFDGVLGSDGTINLSGAAKADALCERFGRAQFDYVGDSRADLKVWSTCNVAIVAGGRGAWHSGISGGQPGVVEIVGSQPGLRDYIAALRPHQWLKNALVFVPAIAGHVLMTTWFGSILAFISFCLCASAVYILNDLLDLRADRQHPRKRNRPFASGRVPIIHGAVMAPSLLLAAFSLTLFLPKVFAIVLAGYLVLTTLYSFWLKRKVLVDVIALACLYAARVVGGSVATGVLISQWLEAFSIFLFLSLALVKRSGELVDRVKSGRGDPGGRGYRLDDLPVIESMAAASGYLSALVMALYLNSEAVVNLYNKPHRLLLICVALLFWTSRMLLKAHRGQMDDDPIVFAARDRVSLGVGAVCLGVVYISL
ncbi:UbiA family prenyltransferase [Tardiphaga sp. 42S5]|uniref:UbiA family prenyltransferase n=1 Tax=Tardiphaga sp. 42S5 TaxID=1404799 RepID=UPI002A5A5C96|nr:UbiA family prenyltransferase [Tardiphaga sp. 42S5]WPO40404.1 UbiA family prenyltransferase [Tardiphaga sp. 42S5]